MAANCVEVEHFSDVLCIWAYISQVRVDELCATYGEQVQVNYRFLSVFGDVQGKMATQWSDRGGLDGYADHVQEVAGQFEHIEIRQDLWRSNTPASSMPAHLALAALKTAEDGAAVESLLRALRHAFFSEQRDISKQDVLLQVADEAGANAEAIDGAMASGAAHAALAADIAAAAQAGVASSPTLRFNAGRQILSGNVGYRVIDANVRELLRRPGEQQSWC